MSYKEARVVMLPTYKKTRIFLSDFGKVLNLCKRENYYHGAQHLYLISEDKIKEDDWYIFENQLTKACYLPNENTTGKKIIATTDWDICYPTGNGNIDSCDPLPKFSEEFLKEYCEKSRSIDKVMVEYEEYLLPSWSPSFNNPDNVGCDAEPELKCEPKVSSLNIISIKPVEAVKESWTRDEVIQMMYKFKYFHDDIRRDGRTISTSEWVEQNLK